MTFRSGPPPPSGDKEFDALVRGYESAAQRDRIREGMTEGRTAELREYVHELRDVQMNPVALERLFIDLYDMLRDEHGYSVGQANDTLKSIVSPG